MKLMMRVHLLSQVKIKCQVIQMFIAKMMMMILIPLNVNKSDNIIHVHFRTPGVYTHEISNSDYVQ